MFQGEIVLIGMFSLTVNRLIRILTDYNQLNGLKSPIYLFLVIY